MNHDISPNATQLARNVLGMLRPHRLEGGKKIRLGRFYDGGYVMVDRFEGVQAAYSLGINDDVSWDLDVAVRGIDVWQYDHTIERLPHDHLGFHWKKIGIGHITDKEKNLETLPNLIAANGHEGLTNMLLKCDIEGSEWVAMAGMPSHVLNQFSQIVIEIHSLGDLHKVPNASIARRAIANLTTHHHVVHVHANNFAAWSVVGGIPVPGVMELTLLNKNQGNFVVSDEIFPTPLDMPCNSRFADLYLGRFSFE